MKREVTISRAHQWRRKIVPPLRRFFAGASRHRTSNPKPATNQSQQDDATDDIPANCRGWSGQGGMLKRNRYQESSLTFYSIEHLITTQDNLQYARDHLLSTDIHRIAVDGLQCRSYGEAWWTSYE